jgi:hypothetical protein
MSVLFGKQIPVIHLRTLICLLSTSHNGYAREDYCKTHEKRCFMKSMEESPGWS